MRESKECLECGGLYFRPEKMAQTHWDARKYCSVACGSKAGLRKAREVREAIGAHPDVVLPLGDALITAALEASVDEPEPAPVQGSTERAPVMRELRIVRVGPNPRLVVCEYFELAQRRTCTVMVKRTDKYVRGMRFAMAEPLEEAAYVRPWVYTGPPPRHRGRW